MHETFHYSRRVAFSDTDAMGVTHHANYMRYCEEARVAWMRARKLEDSHYPRADVVWAVLHFQIWHKKPSRFDDEIQVYLQVRRQGLKIQFQYAMYIGDTRICEAETLHIAVDSELRPLRPIEAYLKVLEKEKWTETWLSNS